MSLLDVADYIRALKFLFRHYRLILLAGVAFIAARVMYQADSLALLSFATVVGAQAIHIAWSRLTAKTRESEKLSRFHLATAEALAKTIDSEEQTTNWH